MGLLEIASGNSFWRGYDYFRDGNVTSSKQIAEGIYSGTVVGSSEAPYDVTIDLLHPKKSTCNCPHAEGTRRVCKHKVALYFAIFPEEADKALEEAQNWEAEEQRRWQEECKEIEKYVNSLSKQELREQLLWRLINERERRRW